MYKTLKTRKPDECSENPQSLKIKSIFSFFISFLFSALQQGAAYHRRSEKRSLFWLFVFRDVSTAGFWPLFGNQSYEPTDECMVFSYQETRA